MAKSEKNPKEAKVTEEVKATEETKEPKKRGRKRKTDYYFGPEQEAAVVEFLESDDQLERTRIYNKWLREPLDKMVSSIIRRYELYSNKVNFEDWHADALSFLIFKSGKFNTGKGKKAYSYYGTICRNYLTGLLIKESKERRTNYSYEDMYGTIEKRDDMMYQLNTSNYSLSQFIAEMAEEIKEEMDAADDEENKNKKKLTDNERKVGYAIIEIMENWESHVDMTNNRKYNKNQFLESVRNYTNLTTKDIRNAMKRYKSLYEFVKERKIDEGYL